MLVGAGGVRVHYDSEMSLMNVSVEGSRPQTVLTAHNLWNISSTSLDARYLSVIWSLLWLSYSTPPYPSIASSKTIHWHTFLRVVWLGQSRPVCIWLDYLPLMVPIQFDSYMFIHMLTVGRAEVARDGLGESSAFSVTCFSFMIRCSRPPSFNLFLPRGRFSIFSRDGFMLQFTLHQTRYSFSFRWLISFYDSSKGWLSTLSNLRKGWNLLGSMNQLEYFFDVRI